MFPRSILVAEDLKKMSPVISAAKSFSKLLREDLEIFPAPPADLLREANRWPRPEMVILGAKEAKDMEKVLLESERPVMVLGPCCREDVLSLKPRKQLRILVATDLTRESRPAEHYALSLAARMDAEVVLFHSVYEQLKRIETSSLVSGMAAFDMERIIRKMIKDAEQSLKRKKARIDRAFVLCDYKINESGASISQSLLEEAHKNNYHLIVMGTHSRRNALVRAFLGSNAKDTILKSEVPVVVVHTH